MLLSLFIVSVIILVISEVAEEQKQKKTRRQKITPKKYLHGRK
jgi:hypothetical protein